MLNRLKLPSPALVLAFVALLASLAGGAYAATRVAKKNSVATKSIRTNAVTRAKIKADAVDGSKVADGSLTGADVADNSLKGDDIDEASLGKVPSAENSDKLEGTGAGGFLRSDDVRADGNVSDTSIDDFTAAVFTDVISKTFTAPKAGFLFINGSISGEDDISLPGPSNLQYRLRLDATPVTNASFAYELSSNAANGVPADSGAAGAVVPVSAGSHTVSLDAREAGTGTFILGRDISAVFVPNGSGVTIPVSKAGGGGVQNK